MTTRRRERSEPPPPTCTLGREGVLALLGAADAAMRARGVRSLCPCRAGWTPFEQDLELLRQYAKDPDPRVRRAALHVFEDAYRMQGEGLPTHPREERDELLATRRRYCFRRDEDA